MNTCLKCHESWAYEDYACPCCGSAAVDTQSCMTATLKYKFYHKKNQYDVIRIATGKSVFDEPGNYINQEDAS